MSRFPNGSPIDLYHLSAPKLLAEFNRDVTPEELVEKLKAVVFDKDTSEITLLAARYSNDILSLYHGNFGSINLIIEGNKVYATDVADSGYIFDVDFDGQHRKVFDQPDGTYIMMMPDLLVPRGEGQEKKYPVVKVVTYEDAKTIQCVVNSEDDDTGFVPNADNAELTDIDVDEWFTEGVGAANFDHITTLMDEILNMEYYSSLPLSFGEVPTDGQIAVDGEFNPFTDGSPYTPLG